jgi:hypothetical protein
MHMSPTGWPHPREYKSITSSLKLTQHASFPQILSASVMLKFLPLLRTKYGGARGYFKNHSRVTDEELDLLCASLLVEGTKEN